MARKNAEVAVAEVTAKVAAPKARKFRGKVLPKPVNDFAGHKSPTGAGRPPKYNEKQIGHMVELVRDNTALTAMKILRANRKGKTAAERELAAKRDFRLFPDAVNICWLTLKRWIGRAAVPVVLEAGRGGHVRKAELAELAAAVA